MNTFFNNMLSGMQGMQGPPNPKTGMLPTAPTIFDSPKGATPNTPSSGGGMGNAMSLIGPVLEGLMAEPKQQQAMPMPSAPPLGRGGQVQPVALPQFNPGSIANRLRGQ